MTTEETAEAIREPRVGDKWAVPFRARQTAQLTVIFVGDDEQGKFVRMRDRYRREAESELAAFSEWCKSATLIRRGPAEGTK